MKIINQTKNKILAQEAIFAHTPWQRIKGLLGKSEFKVGQALILKPCNSIHTFFMRFPIDVLFVDQDNKVIKALTQIKPFRFSGIYFSAVLVIELPAGIIQATATAASDTLALV